MALHTGTALLALLSGLALDAATCASAQGISWPAGQALPRFAPYTALDVADLSGLPFERKAALTTLQGLVNRTTPRIYLLDAQQAGEGKNFWTDKLKAAKTSIADPMSLFVKYRSETVGLCIYDPAVKGTIDVAVTAAGVLGCVASSPALAQILSAAPYSLPITLDLRTRAFADDRAAFAWAKTEFWSRCTHRMLAGLKPGVHYCLMDYLVANRAFCAWLAPEDSLDRPILTSLLRDMPVNGVYLGWWAGETSGVGYASGYGVMTFASDWFANATVHGGGSPLEAGNLPETAAAPKLANKCYIALILSDGDNLQEQEHLFPIRWRSPLRGTFPVSWTQSPAMADFAPAMLEYYYSTRTANDCFITGPSGVGYVLPEKTPSGAFVDFARMTEAYLKRTGIRGATVWGNSGPASDALGQYCPSLLGVVNKQDVVAPRGARYWTGGLPSVEMAPDYASFASQILPEIRGRMGSWTRSRPLFIAPQLNANVAGLEEFKIVYDSLKSNPEVVFVRADQLFQAMRAANPGTIGLAPAPAFKGPKQGAGWIRVADGAFVSPAGIPVDMRGRNLP
ncbi:MAG: hypothetical protein JWP91_644 [Fibrobacteres bacterium]|nr:hypothetical protein [Fibrobacterota bacterium]